MSVLFPLTQCVSKHFSLHPSRQKTLSGLLLGVLNSQCVQHHALSQFVASLNAQASLRRTERFFQGQERLDLLAQFENLFGVDRIESLMADREFVGIKWFETLNQKGVPFFIRIKENTLTPYGKEDMHVGRYFGHLKQGESRKVEKEMYGKNIYFAGTRSKDLGIFLEKSLQAMVDRVTSSLRKVIVMHNSMDY